MSESKHTPGPWLVGECRAQRIVVKVDDGRTVAEAFAPPLRHREAEANARLIAAAPDLLAACKEAETWPDRFEQGPDYHAFRKQLAAAIAKAEAVIADALGLEE